MATIKKIEIDKSQILRDLDLLLKIRHQGLSVWCLTNNLHETINLFSYHLSKSNFILNFDF